MQRISGRPIILDMKNKVSIRKAPVELDSSFEHLRVMHEYIVRVDDLEVARISYHEASWVYESLAEERRFSSAAEAKSWARKNFASV